MKQLRAYQQIAVDKGIKANTLIADQMGLGKSLTAIEIAKAVFEIANAPALIICPKGIRLQWKEMILDQDPQARVSIFEAVDDVSELNRSPAIDYAIIHYEALVKLHPQLAKRVFSTIVVDEAHRIKNRKAQRTSAVKALKTARKIALTGTPFDKNPAEIWSILNWLDPAKFSSFWKFMDQYITFDVDFYGYQKNFRMRDPAAFGVMLQPYMIKRTKALVMPELPPLQITHVPVDLTPAQRKAYTAIQKVKDLEASIDGLDDPLFITNALAKLTRLLQVASDPANLDIPAASAKLEWLKEWISDHPDTSVLVFSRYRRAAEQAASAIGADTLVLGGSKLSANLDASSRRIVATIAAMAEGYDLGHIDVAIYLDCEWSSILMQQSMERIDRGGNTEPKQLIFLEAQNTVDALVRQALENKWSTKQLVDQFLQTQDQHEITFT